MADISAWSPVDESNTAAPPNGWPEYMQNSMVNNCARAMMGAIRRFYDQLIAGTLDLPYLKLSGGGIAGSLSAVEYQLSGVAFAYRDPVNNYHNLVDADGYDAAIYLGGAASGYRNIYRAEHHFIQSNNGSATFATIDSSGITTTQTVSAAVLSAVNVFASGNISGSGTITGGTINSSGNVQVNGAIDCVGNIDGGSFSVNGVPVVLMTMVEFDALNARIAALEAA